MKLLLDTNVLFLALGFRGVPGMLLEEIVRQRHTLVTSDYILEELRENIRRKFTGPQRAAALDLLLYLLERLALAVKHAAEYERHLARARQLVPRQDTPILAAAMLEDVDYLVTGDHAHFLDNPRVKALAEVTLVSPREILNLLTFHQGA